MVFNLTNFSNSTNSTNSNNYNNATNHLKKSRYSEILHSLFIYNFFFIILLCAITPVIIYCVVGILDFLHELITKINNLLMRKKKRNTFVVEMGNMEHKMVGKKNGWKKNDKG